MLRLSLSVLSAWLLATPTLAAFLSSPPAQARRAVDAAAASPAPRMMAGATKSFKLGLVGGGTVGGGIVEILRGKSDLMKNSLGIETVVSKIVVGNPNKARDFELPAGCELTVSIDQVGGSLDCGFGGISNISPGTLLAVEPAPAADGVRFVMQRCPEGEDCVCAVTVSCVGTDIASEYAAATPTLVQAWIQPDELVLGIPGPWECIDCGYGPPFFHAASKLVESGSGGTIDVAPGVITDIEILDGATFETHALDGAAYQIGGLAPVQLLLGTATVEEGQTLALAMDDDLLKLSLRNLRSTWCTDGCGPTTRPPSTRPPCKRRRARRRARKRARKRTRWKATCAVCGQAVTATAPVAAPPALSRRRRESPSRAVARG